MLLPVGTVLKTTEPETVPGGRILSSATLHRADVADETIFWVDPITRSSPACILAARATMTGDYRRSVPEAAAASCARAPFSTFTIA
jgi:hypothetical protein